MFRAIAILALGLLAAPAAADYPERPLRLVVPFAAGGPTDLLARQLAQSMAPLLGQSVVVENRTGAGSTVGTDSVARSAPDGYTLLFATFSHVINATLYKNLPYDSIQDFSPVSMVANSYLLLTTPTRVSGQTVEEFVAAAKAAPTGFNYGSAGVGTGMHLAAAMFNAEVGLDNAVHVPYRGNSQTVPALMGGEVEYAFMGMDTVLPQVRAGSLKGLAVTSRERDPRLPEVPTLNESGLADFEVGIYMMVLAPAGTPAPVVEKLNGVINQALETPEFVRTADGMAGVARMTGYTPASTAEFIAAEIERWAPVIRQSGASAE